MNRSILAACLWALIALVALVGFSSNPSETVCIAAQSIDITGGHVIDAAECFEVTP